MDRLQQIKANHRLNIQAGYVWMRAIDRNWLIEAVEQYANRFKELGMENAILVEDNKRLRLKNRELRSKTSFRVFEENLRLAEEIEKLKGEKSNEQTINYK